MMERVAQARLWWRDNSLAVSFIIAASYSAFKIVLAILLSSWWLGALGAYYLIVASIRLYMLRSRQDGWIVYRRTGWLLVLLNLSVAIVITDVAWLGLMSGMDHFMYVQLLMRGFDVEIGPELVAQAVDAIQGDLDIPDSAQRSDVVAITTQEDVSYLLTDSDGNIIPGTGGQIWVRGTGAPVEWSVPHADDDYEVTLRSSDAEGEIIESGPYPVPKDDGSDGNPLSAVAVLAFIAAYLTFLRFVHREGPFDRRAWIVTGIIIIATGAIGLLYSGIWWQAGLTVTVAVTALSWLYHSDRAAPRTGGS